MQGGAEDMQTFGSSELILSSCKVDTHQHPHHQLHQHSHHYLHYHLQHHLHHHLHHKPHLVLFTCVILIVLDSNTVGVKSAKLYKISRYIGQVSIEMVLIIGGH